MKILYEYLDDITQFPTLEFLACILDWFIELIQVNCTTLCPRFVFIPSVTSIYSIILVFHRVILTTNDPLNAVTQAFRIKILYVR